MNENYILMLLEGTHEKQKEQEWIPIQKQWLPDYKQKTLYKLYYVMYYLFCDPSQMAHMLLVLRCRWFVKHFLTQDQGTNASLPFGSS